MENRFKIGDQVMSDKTMNIGIVKRVLGNRCLVNYENNNPLISRWEYESNLIGSAKK